MLIIENSEIYEEEESNPSYPAIQKELPETPGTHIFLSVRAKLDKNEGNNLPKWVHMTFSGCSTRCFLHLSAHVGTFRSKHGDILLIFKILID